MHIKQLLSKGKNFATKSVSRTLTAEVLFQSGAYTDVREHLK